MKHPFLLSWITTTTFCCSLYADANPNMINYLEAMLNDLQVEVATIRKEAKEKMLNPSAAPHVNGGSDVFITGDFLYWKANENGLDYAVKRKVISETTPIDGNGDLINPNFNWDPGFRVGIGWNTNHDDWDLSLFWTRLHTSAQGHRHAGNQHLYGVYATGSSALVAFDKASAYLKIHLNVLDLELGREFYVGKSLSIRPHVGLENVWISQHYTTKYDGHPAFQNSAAAPSDYNHIFFRNHFWGVGARAGLDTQWELGWGFSFVGDLAASLLYGDFNLKRTCRVLETVGIADSSKAHIDKHLTQGRTALEFFLGIEWDVMLIADRFHFATNLGWEQHIYFGQNQIFNFESASGTTDRGKITSSNDDLTFQGLTLSMRLDF